MFNRGRRKQLACKRKKERKNEEKENVERRKD